MGIRFSKIVCLISVITILNCNTTAISETDRQNIINNNAIQVYDSSSFIIKFTNLIYENDGKIAKIPVFQGNMGDTTYKKFLEYCYNNNLLKKGYGEGGFIVTSEKGKLTSKFHEFLNFYKGNILKDVDINKPTSFEVWGNPQYESEIHITISYDFKVNGIPFVLFVSVYSAEQIANSAVKSIFDIKLQERTNPPTFLYAFYENTYSKDL